jgi:HEAT repeat protein
MTANRGWLLIFLALPILVLAYLGYTRWRDSQIAEALKNPDPVVRMDAVRKAGQGGHGNLLVQALRDEDPDIRFVAASSIGPLGPGDSDRIRALLELWKDDHDYVRKEARHTLQFASPDGRKLIYKAVEDKDPKIRAAAIHALLYVPPIRVMGMEYPPPPRPAGDREMVVSQMIRLLKDEDLEVRKAASFCLFSYNFKSDEAQRILSALKEAPEENDQDARDLVNRLKRAAEFQARNQ